MNDPAGGRESTWDVASGRRSGLGSRGVVRSAFAVSVAVHVLAIFLYPALSRRIDPQGIAFPFPAFSGSPDGIEVIEVVEVDVVQDVERPDDPREIERIETTQVEIQGPSLGERTTIDLPTPGLTPAEILRPRFEDGRLWGALPPEFSELTLEQREELLLAGALAAWQDSASAAALAAARWTDWTFTDSNGGRWGISEGQLHLGDLTLPLPTFDAPPGSGAREFMWQWDEIARQGAQAQVQQTVRERLEAIRERRDQERERERAAARADTTRN